MSLVGLLKEALFSYAISDDMFLQLKFFEFGFVICKVIFCVLS